MNRTPEKAKRAVFAMAAIVIATSVNAATEQGLGILPVCSRTSRPVGLPSDAPPPAKMVSVDSRSAQATSVLNITYKIEGGGIHSYDAITPNFDGYGFSLGLVQFNFSGEAQSTFKKIPQSVFDGTMKTWGKTFYSAVHASSTKAIELTKTMQYQDKKHHNAWVVKDDALIELRAFLNSPESHDAQDASIHEIYAAGYSRALQWANARGEVAPSTREIVSFVDNQIFSGGDLGGMWLPQATAFRKSFPDDGRMVDFVSTWIASCPQSGDALLYDAKYGQADADAWRSKVPVGASLPDEQALLFAVGFLKALSANGPKLKPKDAGIFKSQVLQRRGMMALGAGTANGVAWPGTAQQLKRHPAPQGHNTSNQHSGAVL
ncbi:hypothetical protein PQR67_35595 [Paraburkholderia fungorum]|uniref:hypothetical protein n=1 Tax=Paraburkholderia fungorum TaxID=134537 RepID=UPI0038B976A1